ncbi:YhjD/YihY/BrkB family envelope integrity protein [Enemella sp. A6]|uniref:YhjD/YihY/BrkB family envelope integrity protein n=1 Tax=Enemella sp. A6 TaxID=3440152 RepID=UPI003EB7CA5C
MGDFIEKVKTNPIVAHLLRAAQRFNTRLGNQFGAAITYFSVLAMVPILMFAFATTGFVLTELRPELLDQVKDQLLSSLSGVPEGVGGQVSELIESFLTNWRGVGIVGLLSAMYSGAGWAGNLKSAVRAQWRPEFDMSEQKRFIVVEVLINLLILVGLLVLVVLTFGLATTSTSMADTIIGWLGWQDVPGIGWILRLAPILASALAGWVLFVYLYKVLPQTPVPFKHIAKGALIGSIGLAALQYLTTFLVSSFTGNPAAALFGPVIVLMLFFNLFARLILFVAAWIATSVQPVTPVELTDVDKPLVDVPESDVESWQFDDDQPQKPGVDYRTPASAAWQGQQAREIGPDEWVIPPEPDESIPVNQKVAAQAVKVGSVTGWVVGAATGMGLGAFITRFITNRTKRKK